MKKNIILSLCLAVNLIFSINHSFGQAPTFTSFTPASGAIGSSVTITGTNFNTTANQNIVFFGATKATVTAANATSLTVTVPIGANYQYISVTNLAVNLTAYSAQPFIVTYAGNIAFAPQDTSVITGSTPRSVAIGDLDGDGKSDLAVCNSGNNNVSVYLNTSTVGTISFGTKLDFAVNGSPYFVSMSDIDGDGKLDLAVANSTSSNVSVLRNTSSIGTINFAAKADFTTGPAPYSLCIGDIDRDGKPDLAVGNYGNATVSLLRNSSTLGTISFVAKVDFTTGSGPNSVGIGDIDGDSKPDLAIANYTSSTISVLLSTSTVGSISFLPKVDFSSGTNPINLGIGDLDGDGKPDVAVSNWTSNNMSTFRNTSTSGAVSFATRADLATGNSPRGASIADIDGDGKPEFSAPNSGSNTVSVFPNTSTSGTISFATKLGFNTKSAPRALCVGDIDGDGKLDLAAANYSNSTVSIFRQIIPPPLVNSFTPSNGCAGTTPVVITGTNFTGATSVSIGGVNVSGFTVDSPTQITATIGSGTTGTISVTTAGGTGTSASSFTINPLPTVSANASVSNVCAGTSVTLTGSGSASSYTWSGGVSDGIAFVPATTLTYTVTGTDANGCVNTSTTTVVVNPIPTDVLLTPTNETCGNANGTLTIESVTGGTPAYTYSVSPGPVGFSATTNFSSLSANTYTVTVRDANLCTYTSTTTLSNLTGPIDVALFPTNASCGNPNGSVTIGAVNGGASPYSYSFDGSAFTLTTSYSSLSAATYTVIVKDANSCTYQKTVVINNLAGPTDVALTSANSTCSNANGSITIGVVTGGGGTNLFSINGGSFTSTTLYTGLAAATYTIDVNDNNGCTYQETIVVANTAGPSDIQYNSSNTTCSNIDGSVTVTGATGGTPNYTYSFNGSPFTLFGSYSGLNAGSYTLIVKDANLCTFEETVVIGSVPGPTNLDVTTTNATCGNSNGTIQIISVTGGVAPYRYAINTGLYSTTTLYTSLAANTYSVYVIDNNNCEFYVNAVISAAPTPSLSIGSSTNVSCFAGNNGSATIGTAGGAAPFIYSWSPSGGNAASAFGLSAGNYTCTVIDANLCVATKTVSITQPSALSLSISSTNALCGDNNGSAMATVGGGTSPYVYQWSSGSQQANADTLFPGQYIVQVYDVNGCNRSATVNINASNGPTIILNSLTNVTCNNGSNGAISISATGGALPYTYSWSNGDTIGNTTGLLAGQYDISVTDANNCTVVETYNITEPAPLTISFTSTPASCGASDGDVTADVLGGTGAYSYLWSANASSQTNATATGLAAGIYTLTVTDAVSCSLNSVVSISSAGAAVTVAVDTVLAASCGSSSTGEIQITATGGTSTYNYSWSNASTIEDQIGLTPGQYFVTATDGNGCVGTASATVPSALAGYQPAICLVTVDTNTFTNQIIWEKTVQNGVKAFKIYREAATNSYLPIATVPFANLSEFSDPTANPAIRSWRYKISAIDSCDIETPLSSPHKTIHLNQNAGLGGTVNLIWDFYDGYTYDYFYIWRDDPSTGWELIDSLPSNLTSYTDLTPPSVDSRYMIEIRPPSPCNTTLRLANNGHEEIQTVVVKSKSNIKNNRTVGLKNNSLNSLNVKVFPNPAIDILNVEVLMKNGEEATIVLENMLGQVVYSTETTQQKNTVNTSSLNTGVYFVKVKTAKGSSVEKVIIE